MIKIKLSEVVNSSLQTIVKLSGIHIIYDYSGIYICVISGMTLYNYYRYKRRNRNSGG